MKVLKKVLILLVPIIFCWFVGLSNILAATVTIRDTRVGHEYEFYQIFSGDYSEGLLTNIEWGSGIDIDSDKMSVLMAELKNQLIDFQNFSDDETAYDVSKVLEGYLQSDSWSDIKTFSKIIANNLSDTPYTTLLDGESIVEISDSGYYLVKDVVNNGDIYSLHLLTVIDTDTNLDLLLKFSEIAFDKEVQEDTGNWVHATDYDIGDAIPYRIRIALPSNYDEFEKYELVIGDQFGESLTLDEGSIVIKVDGVIVNENNYFVSLDETYNFNGEAFIIEFEDLKQIPGVTSTSIITVEYNAVLNENAVIGATGNPNRVYLRYSSDPNGTDAMSETPYDECFVYTYKLIVDKFDEVGNPLEGAAFKLEKLASDGFYYIVNEITGDDISTFEFVGLDRGTYRLTEVAAPSGYNKLTEPIEFSIEAEIDDDMFVLTSLDVSVDELDMTGGDIEEGIVWLGITNDKGVSLPSTGGIGTIVFTISGLMIMITCLYLISKRKRQN